MLLTIGEKIEAWVVSISNFGHEGLLIGRWIVATNNGATCMCATVRMANYTRQLSARELRES